MKNVYKYILFKKNNNVCKVLYKILHYKEYMQCTVVYQNMCSLKISWLHEVLIFFIFPSLTPPEASIVKYYSLCK